MYIGKIVSPIDISKAEIEKISSPIIRTSLPRQSTNSMMVHVPFCGHYVLEYIGDIYHGIYEDFHSGISYVEMKGVIFRKSNDTYMSFVSKSFKSMSFHGYSSFFWIDYYGRVFLDILPNGL